MGPPLPPPSKPVHSSDTRWEEKIGRDWSAGGFGGTALSNGEGGGVQKGRRSLLQNKKSFWKEMKYPREKGKWVIFTLPGGWPWISPAGTLRSALRPRFLRRWNSSPGTCRSGWSCRWWRCRRCRTPPPDCWPAGSSPAATGCWPEWKMVY